MSVEVGESTIWVTAGHGIRTTITKALTVAWI